MLLTCLARAAGCEFHVYSQKGKFSRLIIREFFPSFSGLIAFSDSSVYSNIFKKVTHSSSTIEHNYHARNSDK